MIDYNKALSYALTGEAIFIVGSGFSIGAENIQGTRLLTGVGLQEDLCKKLDSEMGISLDVISREYIETHGKKELIEYLKSNYIVNKYEPYYKVFSKIKNLKVFSTNYDNLLENICRDNSKKCNTYTLSEDIRKSSKKDMIIHINGYIETIDQDFDNDFKLTHLSYDRTPLYQSPWYAYIKEIMRSVEVIFVVGLSFASDLDVRRLISCDTEENLKEKCFIIQSPNIKESTSRTLSKYGKVMQNGIEQFCIDLNNATPAAIDKVNYKFKSFINYQHEEVYENPSGENIFKMLFHGNISENKLYFKDENGKFAGLVNREKIELAKKYILDGESLILHSDLGNGKSMFINQLRYLLPKIKFFKRKENSREKFIDEIHMLCEDESPKVIIIDPYNLYLDELQQIANFDLENCQFIFSARTAMYENTIGILYGVIEKMKNVKTRTLNLNILENSEIDEFNKIISKYGLWGDESRLSEERKIEFLRSSHDFQGILLKLFKNGDIQNRFEKILKKVYSNEIIRKILILSFINEILQLRLTIDDFSIIFKEYDIDRILRTNTEDVGEIVGTHYDIANVKSSIISKALISSSIVNKQDVLRILLETVGAIDDIYQGSYKYNEALKNLSSASYLSFIFDYNLDSELLLAYYDKIRENSCNTKNTYFWLQYAITCVNLKKYDLADIYFKTSYSFARRKGRDFSTFQIDNHYSRYLLENQLYVRNYEKSLDRFLEAHKLLIKRYIAHDDINEKYYQFKVARLYKEYYDVFFDSFDETQKDIFLIRCKEMQKKLIEYINNRQSKDIELKNYIIECKMNLDYIFLKHQDIE